MWWYSYLVGLGGAEGGLAAQGLEGTLLRLGVEHEGAALHLGHSETTTHGVRWVRWLELIEERRRR